MINLSKIRLSQLNVNIDTRKILRLFIAVFMFATLFQIYNNPPRDAQQIIFNLGAMCLFALVIDNIWVALFTLWTVVLFGLYKCQSGNIYVSNIFAGLVLYYLTKLTYRKEHINFYIKIFLWFTAINLFYSIIQVLGRDFLYSNPVTNNGVISLVQNLHPGGFMLNEAWLGMVLVLAIPLLATRSNVWLSGILFFPIFLTRSSMSMIGACVVFLFILFFRVKRWVFILLLTSCLIAGALFYVYVDQPGTERFDVWTKTLQVVNSHPIIGWGLDSFRRADLPHKNFIFSMDTSDRAAPALWDNPHNLYISLLFEFGLIGLLIFGGYIRQLAIWFRKSIKSPNTLGLAGFALGVLVLSIGNFPMFLARFCSFIIPCFALLECSLTE